MTAGRRLWAGLDLLDRQLVDRNGGMAGCVDDLELAQGDGEGQLYVAAILSGPGALAQRLRARRYGAWLRRLHALMSPADGDPTRIPFHRVTDVGDRIALAADREDLGSVLAERWARDHVVGHIPGSGHAPE